MNIRVPRAVAYQLDWQRHQAAWNQSTEEHTHSDALRPAQIDPTGPPLPLARARLNPEHGSRAFQARMRARDESGDAPRNGASATGGAMLGKVVKVNSGKAGSTRMRAQRDNALRWILQADRIL